MLPRYRPAIGGFSTGVIRALQVRLCLPQLPVEFCGPPLPLYDSLSRAGLGQADVVLELLRLDLIPEVEALIGHPITRCPTRVYRPLPLAPRAAPGPDDRRVLSVVRNPRLPTTDSFQRFRLIQPGTTISSLLKRGVTRKDLRECARNSWVVLSELRS